MGRPQRKETKVHPSWQARLLLGVGLVWLVQVAMQRLAMQPLLAMEIYWASWVPLRLLGRSALPPESHALLRVQRDRQPSLPQPFQEPGWRSLPEPRPV